MIYLFYQKTDGANARGLYQRNLANDAWVAFTFGNMMPTTRP